MPSHRSATFLFVVGTILYASNSIIVVASKNGDTHIKFHLSAVVLFAELLRFFGACALVFVFGASSELTHFFSRKLFRFAVPAFIYAANDEIAFRCMEHMDSATFQTLSNFKILTTAILCNCCLGSKITKRQWVALAILTVATIGGALSNTTTSGGASIHRHQMTTHHTQHHHIARHHVARAPRVEAVTAAPKVVLPVTVESDVTTSSTHNHEHDRRSLLFFSEHAANDIRSKHHKYHYSRDAYHGTTKSTTTMSTTTTSTTPTAANTANSDNDSDSVDGDTEENARSTFTPSKQPSTSSLSLNENEFSEVENESEPDELEKAIAEHSFFITREGVFLVLLYSMLSATAATYSEWLLRDSHLVGKGHGEFATPAASAPSAVTPMNAAALATRNRMLINSPSSVSGTPLSSSGALSPIPVIVLDRSNETPPQFADSPRQQSIVIRGARVHNESLPTKMVRIYFWGIIFSIIHCVIEINVQYKNHGSRTSLLEGFNVYTWVLIINQALMGLILTAIIHQMGAMSKLFLLSFAMILTSIVTIFAFHLIPNFLFCVSFAMMIGAILMYNHESFVDEHNTDDITKGASMTPLKLSMAKVANQLYAYMFAATVLFVLGGGVATSLSIRNRFISDDVSQLHAEKGD